MGLTSINAVAGGALGIEFGDTNFPTPTVLDNPYWPLLPANVGTRTATYIGEGEEECVINTVSATTGDIKSDFQGDYAGFTAQVVLDQEWEVEDCADQPTDDDLKELTRDWYMQDEYGNIWYLGEASRDFEDECPSLADVPLGTEDWGVYGFGDLQEDCTGGSWEAGSYGPDEELIAEAGIVVPGNFPDGINPLTTGTYYMQEEAEGAEDMAKILKLNATVVIESGEFAGEYTSCRKVKEYTLLEPGASVEHKYYCAVGQAGLLLINGVGGGPTEVEVLVDVTES
jgi:hypothetical protein